MYLSIILVSRISPVSTIEYLDGMFLCGGGFHGGGFLVEDKGETPEQILRWMKKFEKKAIESYNEAIMKGFLTKKLLHKTDNSCLLLVAKILLQITWTVRQVNAISACRYSEIFTVNIYLLLPVLGSIFSWTRSNSPYLPKYSLKYKNMHQCFNSGA